MKVSRRGVLQLGLAALVTPSIGASEAHPLAAWASGVRMAWREGVESMIAAMEGPLTLLGLARAKILARGVVGWSLLEKVRARSLSEQRHPVLQDLLFDIARAVGEAALRSRDALDERIQVELGGASDPESLSELMAASERVSVAEADAAKAIALGRPTSALATLDEGVDEVPEADVEASERRIERMHELTLLVGLLLMGVVVLMGVYVLLFAILLIQGILPGLLILGWLIVSFGVWGITEIVKELRRRTKEAEAEGSVLRSGGRHSLYPGSVAQVELLHTWVGQE